MWPAGSRLTNVRRVMREETRPVAYLIDTLPEDVLKPEQLPAHFKGSVLDFLLGRGDPLTVSKAAISAIGAPADVAKALQIQRGDVLLEFVSQAVSLERQGTGLLVKLLHSGVFPLSRGTPRGWVGSFGSNRLRAARGRSGLRAILRLYF